MARTIRITVAHEQDAGQAIDQAFESAQHSTIPDLSETAAEMQLWMEGLPARILHIILPSRLFLSSVLLLAIALVDEALAQSADGLPLPPGQIIVGPVFRGANFTGKNPGPGSSVPSIANGVDANIFVETSAPTLSFVNSTSSPAAVVLTTAPTQYVRFYLPGFNSAPGAFLVGSNAVRGLTPEQIRDVLALPVTPTMETIVLLPAGTCLLVGTAGPILGNFPANPPAIPTPGPWGRGGAVQEYLIGSSQGGPGCGPVPQNAGSFVNRQPIGQFALAYAPRAGGGNAGAVANALDHAPPPPLFSDMDTIYNALDLLNFGAPGPLGAALAQLDGEIYADAPSVAIAAGQMFLDALRDQTHLARSFANPTGGDWRPWISSFGGGGDLFGGGDRHGLGFGGDGIAAGGDYRFTPSLQIGVAAAYMRSAFSAAGFAGGGGMDSFAIGSYAGYALGPWYAEGALGYSYNSAAVNRSIDFPGVNRGAFGNVAANAFLSRAEGGYHIALDDRAAVTPFASFQGVIVGQNSFTEGGAGAVNLNVENHNAALALSTLGAELSYGLPLGLSAPLSVSARAGWAHDFADVHRSVTASFQGSPDAIFTVNGAHWPRDAAAVGLRVSLPVQEVNLFIRYDGTLANAATIHSATAGATIAF